MERICPFCGKSFRIRPNRLKNQKIATCGKMPCFALGHRKKEREPVKRMCKVCGKLFDTCMSDIERGRGNVCSIECYRGSLNGNRNPNWKGGIKPLTKQIRDSDKMAEWRSKVFKRDNFTCFKCGKIGGKLQVHHIIPFTGIIESYKFYHGKPTLEKLLEYPPLWSTANGITLCKACHGKFPKNIKKDSICISPDMWPVLFYRIREEGGLAFVATSVDEVAMRLQVDKGTGLVLDDWRHP